MNWIQINLSKLRSFSIFTYLIVGLCIFHLTANLIWINLNKVPPPWDQSGHTILAYKFADYFEGLSEDEFLNISDYYPPLIHILVALLMIIFGRDWNIGPFLVTGFFIISQIFLYLYTYQLFKNRLTAFIATLFFSFLPSIFSLSRYFLLEIPLIATVLASLYFLEKSDNFKNNKFVYLFSTFAGFSLLIKWVAVVYLFVPVAVKFLRGAQIKNLLKSLLIIFLINFLWYLANFGVILYATKITATAEQSDPKIILSYENFKYYFHLMTNFQLTWLGILTFLSSIPIFIIFQKLKNFSLILSFIFIYIVFTFIGNKDLRYTIFLVPIASIIISYFLTKLIQIAKTTFNKIIASLICFILAGYYLFYFFSLSFGIPINPIRDHIRKTVFIPYFGGVDLINLGRDSSHFLAAKYNGTFWPNLLIADELSKHDPSGIIKILLIVEKPQFNQVNMELSRRQLKLNKIEFQAPYALNTFSTDAEIENYLVSYQLILIADEDLGPQGGIRHIEIMKQLKKYLVEGKSNRFIKINNYFLPDGDRLIVYKPNTN